MYINVYKIIKKNGIKINSNFRLRLNVCDASNFVTKMCDVLAKIPHNENIFAKSSIFWLNSSPSHKFNSTE